MKTKYFSYKNNIIIIVKYITNITRGRRRIIY